MTRSRTFTKGEIMDAARAASETGLTSRLMDDGCIVIGDRDSPRYCQYPSVPFPERNDGASFVYFLQVGCYIKIGVAVDIRRRHSDIQGNNPEYVRLIHFIVGNAEDELEMHRRFERQRHNREWFILAGDLYDFLNERTGQP